MERKRRVRLNEEWVEATELGFRPTGEYWNEYLLDDGTVARIKLVVTNVLRIEGKVDAKGQPIYLIESTNVTAISAEQEDD